MVAACPANVYARAAFQGRSRIDELRSMGLKSGTADPTGPAGARRAWGRAFRRPTLAQPRRARRPSEAPTVAPSVLEPPRGPSARGARDTRIGAPLARAEQAQRI